MSVDATVGGDFEKQSADANQVAPKTLWSRIDLWLERAGERLNPILVKEARQAMKSKHFTITFTLLLLTGWIWSLAGIVMLMPDVYYSASGRFMLSGYYFILAFPLLLIVPFAAFRSLAAERDDGTYELLSITSLTSRQIITGKLGSAILQMLVYYSALAPCIAFTYLLRGVDVFTIILLLFYTFVASLLLSVIGLLLAAVSRSRVWQMFISVLMLIALVIFAWSWALGVSEFLQHSDSMPTDDPDFWLANVGIVSGCASYFAILLLVAAAQNSFASDNRSTYVRYALLAQTILYLGWMTYLWLRYPDWEAPIAMLIMAAIHWYIYGVFLTGESPDLSPRVRRSLPQSLVGRLFLTWFNPGSGTGYVFTVITFGGLAIIMIVGVFASQELVNLNSRFGPAMISFQDRLLQFYALLVAYFVIYLGIGRLLIQLIRTRMKFGFFLPIMVHVLVLLMGCAFPLFLDMWVNGYQTLAYSELQAPNFIWTLGEVVDWSNGLTKAPLVTPVVITTAVFVFFFNLLFVASEIRQDHVVAPERVLEEENLAELGIQPASD